ncbi:Beta-propeller repeat protein [Fervidobacterium pennivorans DSM 9078]|uniref:Beta-propeller repeat protein n=1 Tax=Fervidobacterium pennivorans (strain DSM 9078 / Ven5) TaxID=771875 RepID=H9UBD2_FERPD|nr:SBBP repeat-containing protein [Fervidobacterium pennivorans]AFG34825.1 Beta-propeller repeat protein [Fervidobacterium pennivorans DSM 9078]
MKQLLIFTLLLILCLSVAVFPQSPTFNISLKSNTLSVVQGGSGSLSLTITPVNKFTGTVTLSLVNAPKGITLKPTTVSVKKSTVTQTITISVEKSVSAGKYSLTLRVASGNIVKKLAISLTVTKAPEPSISVSVSPSKITVSQGNSSFFNLTVVPSGGFTGSVKLELQKAPSGITLTPSSFSVGKESVTQRVAVKVDNSVDVGVYNITLKVTGGNIVKTVNLEVVVRLPSGTLIWSKQFGSNSEDEVCGLATDSQNNIIIAGSVKGNLDSNKMGVKDVFLRKFDFEGNLIWGRQFGSDYYDEAYGVAVDSNDNIIVVGYTYKTLGKESYGLVDAYIRKYDKDGNVIWTTQFGTKSSEVANSVAVDKFDNIYVAGYTWGNLEGVNKGAKDAYVCKFDPDGNIVWKRQIGTEYYDEIFNIAVDSQGNIYIAGYTWGVLGEKSNGSQDIIVAKLDTFGNLIWISQFGTDKLDEPHGIALDTAGNIYIAGYTNGSLFTKKESTRDIDIIIVKLDKNGKIVFGVQLDSNYSASSESYLGQDSALDIVLSSDGKIFIVGGTTGNLAGKNQGYEDAFVILLDQFGKTVWIKQFGTPETDIAQSVALDKENIIVVGTTWGDLEGENQGMKDIFIRKYSP